MRALNASAPPGVVYLPPQVVDPHTHVCLDALYVRPFADEPEGASMRRDVTENMRQTARLILAVQERVGSLARAAGWSAAPRTGGTHRSSALELESLKRK